MGNKINIQSGYRQCVGFIPTEEVKEINAWIKKSGIETQEGFANIYDNLNEEVKQELLDFGSPDKNEMFEFYLNNLVSFYKEAESNENSVVICAE